MNILVTGGAGFIGYYVTKYLASSAHTVTVIDNMNDYYDVELKQDRLKRIKDEFGDKINFAKLDLTDENGIDALFKEQKFDAVINLAAQAGVRYARKNPRVYINSNINGFFNILDAAQRHACGLILYASSSSVYGGNTKTPFEESDKCSDPLSVYAASKLSDEMMANSYAATFGIKCIGLRFFNVYGAWGRPDAVYFKWMDALTKGSPVDLREGGEMYRDMTYIDDVVKSIGSLVDYGVSQADGFHEVFNIGNENPVRIGDLLDYLVETTGKQPTAINKTPKGAEEPTLTRASTEKLKAAINYAPATNYQDGINRFIEWYQTYYSTK